MIPSFAEAIQLTALILNYYLPVNGFSLETRLPVVKYGPKDSYFGYSVAAHQYRVEWSTGHSNHSEGLYRPILPYKIEWTYLLINDQQKRVILQSWKISFPQIVDMQIRPLYGSIRTVKILVGAPLGQNLQPNTTRSGALWRCPLTNEPEDCKQVVTDGRRDSARDIYKKATNVDSNELFPPGKDEDKTDQWLGVTVKSQGPGGKVLVCAHRYKHTKSFENATSNNSTVYGLGLCYVLRSDLEFLSVLNHCYGKERENGHVGYGFCQIGTSGMIFEDDSAVIGAPGPLTWRGAIFVSSVSDDFLQRDKLVYEGVETRLDKLEESENPDAHIRKVAYMGMSVTAGYFLGDKTTVYVAGAPRNKDTGEVILFTKSQYVGQPSQEGRLLKERLIISGEQIASNFGYEVIGADVNGDKLPDLIVAAPFYFSNERGGAVYIYLNDPHHHFNVVSKRLTGKPESRFGFAMTSLGDLNKDGFEDIAIGAPYEDGGVVYVYLGSKNGIGDNPSQVIHADTDRLKDHSLRTFGYSLSGGIDLDENGYPDLVVGAYESDKVVLLRARPIIGIRTFVRSLTNLTNFDPNARNCLINNTNYAPCFVFKTCCIIDSILKNKIHTVSIEYELQAETFNKRRETSRIWFDDFSKKSHIILKNLTLESNGKKGNIEYCDEHTAYLKENTLDIQSPIEMRLSYKLINEDPTKPRAAREFLPLDNYPILNQQEADKVFSAHFRKDCGNDNECESELVVMTSLSLKQIPDKEDYELVLGEHEKLFMNVNVTNIGESAYQTMLFINLAESTSYSKSTDLKSMKKDVCSSLENGTLVVCRLGNPMKQNEQIILQLEIDIQAVNEKSPPLSFSLKVNTTSEDRRKNDIKFLDVKVIDRAMIHISGDSSPDEVPELVTGEVIVESNMKFKEEVGTRVIHSYTVVNNGLWHQSNIDLDIDWPYQVGNDKVQGKWLLYLDEKPEIEVSGNSSAYCSVSNFINPLNLTERPKSDDVTNVPSPIFMAGDKDISNGKIGSSKSNGISNRVTRDVEKVITSETYTDKNGNKRQVVKMICELGTAKCHRILCHVEYIERKQFVKIKMKSRLWQATLIEDYASVNEINIASKAKVHIPETSVRVKNAYPDETLVKTIARVTLHGQQPSAPIPLFIIILAIVIGLLLFMLLTWLLWKLGFFKRRRPDPTLSGNLEKHRIDDSYHDY